MRTITTAFLSCILWLAAPPVFAAGDPYQQLAQHFDPVFKSRLQSAGVPGGAYAIVSRDGIQHIGTFGHTDLTRSQPVDDNTLFRLASVSKTFAGTLAGMVVHEGNLSWDEQVYKYAPDFRLQEGTWRIRLSHILGQTSGLISHAYDHLIEEDRPLSYIHKKFNQLSLSCLPGKCYGYQNVAFSLVQPMLEQVTGQSYGELLDNRLFTPLQMQTASVGLEPFLASPNRAQPHVKRNGRWKPVPVLPTYYRIAPAAGVNASARDMGHWLTAMLGARPDVIPEAVLEDVTRPRIRTPRDLRRKHWRDHLRNAHYGLGWRIYDFEGEELVYHSGWVSGFRADAAFNRDRNIGIAILMNGEGTVISELTTTFLERALDQLPPPILASSTTEGSSAR